MQNLNKKIFIIYHQNDTMTTDSALAFEEIGCFVKHEIIESIDQNKIIDDIKLFNPDIVFILNTFSLNESCDLIKTISDNGFYSALWFIDNPFYFYNQLISMINIKNLIIFCYDKFYIKHLKSLGLKNVFYLPQATNPKRFYKMELSTDWEIKEFTHNLTFAGNLDLIQLNNFICEFFKKNPEFNDDFYKILSEIEFLAINNLTVPTWELIQEYFNKLKIQIPINTVFLLLKIVEYHLSIIFREQMINSINDLNPCIWGDSSEWQTVVKNVKLLGRVSYFKNMPKVFNGSKININISRLQQRMGTNQRVYDVPACKAFVITDYKAEIEELFEIDKEIIIYKNFSDLKNKILKYQDPNLRIPIIENGFQKVISKHTYANRMQTVIDTFEKISYSPSI